MISLYANIRRPRARWSGRKWNISNREGVNIHYRQKHWLAHPSQRQIDRSELEICGRPLLSRLTTGLLVGHDSNRHLKQILPPTLTDVQILFCKFSAGYRTYQHSTDCSILNFIKMTNIRSPRFEHHKKTARIMHVNLQASFKLTTAFVPNSERSGTFARTLRMFRIDLTTLARFPPLYTDVTILSRLSVLLHFPKPSDT